MCLTPLNRVLQYEDMRSPKPIRIVQRKHTNNHVQTSALLLNILSMANSYP